MMKGVIISALGALSRRAARRALVLAALCGSMGAGLAASAQTSAAGAPTAPIVQAVRAGDVAAVRALLRRHVDLNAPLPDGSSLLAWAVESQSGDMVRLLLDHGAKANGVGDLAVAPLFIACQYGDAAILGALLDKHANVKATRPDGLTPLALCAGSAPAPILERMIAAGAAIDTPDSAGQTPLMHAAAFGRIDNIKLLVARGAKVNRQSTKGFTPLFFSLKSPVTEVPTALLDLGADPNYTAPDGTTAVQLAMYQKNYDFAARMITRGANLTALDRNGNQLLHAAVLADQPQLVQLLLTKGADANALTGPSTVKMRFEVNFKTGDYQVPPKPPLLMAAEAGNAKVMQLLVSAGAKPDFRMPDGTNVLLAAAASSKLEALRLALQLAPDPNIATKRGDTALHILLGGGIGDELAPMMKLLAERGARTDLKNRAGQTASDLAKEAQTDAQLAYQSVFGMQRVSQR